MSKERLELIFAWGLIYLSVFSIATFALEKYEIAFFVLGWVFVLVQVFDFHFRVKYFRD